MAASKSPMGSAYGFSKPKLQSVEVSNSSFVLQFASRRFLHLLVLLLLLFLLLLLLLFLLLRFLDNLLQADESGRRYRQLKDAEFNDNDPNGLQELMDVLPNIDLSDVMEIPKVLHLLPFFFLLLLLLLISPLLLLLLPFLLLPPPGVPV